MTAFEGCTATKPVDRVVRLDFKRRFLRNGPHLDGIFAVIPVLESCAWLN